MTRIKIAHVATVDMSLRRLLLDQLLAIQQAGYDVTGISAPGPDIPAVEAAGVRHIAAPLTRTISPLRDLRALWRLYCIMRRGGFTIVHTHTPKAGLLGQYAAFLARVPVRVHTIHGLYFPGHMKASRRWLYVLMERMTMIFSHLNLSVGPEDIPVAIADHICAADRIELIGSGIDLRRFDPDSQTPERRAATRRSLGLPKNSKVVGTVARFVAEKGYVELLEAARIVRKREPSARFIFVGPLEPGKKDALDPGIIGEMGLDDVVGFLGLRDDVVDLYAIMDMLVLASHREGFPRAPMEAAAMGVPSVVTNIRGCRQTVEEGVTGHLVPVGDSSALAAAILDLLGDEEKRLAFGHAARQKALAEFDENHCIGRILKAYDSLLEKHFLPR